MKDLAQSELIHQFTTQEKIKELDSQYQDIEDQYQLSQDELINRMQQIRQKEELYRDSEFSKYDQIKLQVGHG